MLLPGHVVVPFCLAFRVDPRGDLGSRPYRHDGYVGYAIHLSTGPDTALLPTHAVGHRSFHWLAWSSRWYARPASFFFPEQLGQSKQDDTCVLHAALGSPVSFECVHSQRH